METSNSAVGDAPKGMTNRRRRTRLLMGVALLLLLGLAVVGLRDSLAYIYYIRVATRCRELPAGWIRHAFQYITGRELPQKTEGLRAIYRGGREPAIFVRFETDSVGITYLVKTFGWKGATLKKLDLASLKPLMESGWHLFVLPSMRQEELGICLFDQNSIDSGYSLGGGFDQDGLVAIVIDDQRNVVYMEAYIVDLPATY